MNYFTLKIFLWNTDELRYKDINAYVTTLKSFLRRNVKHIIISIIYFCLYINNKYYLETCNFTSSLYVINTQFRNFKAFKNKIHFRMNLRMRLRI